MVVIKEDIEEEAPIIQEHDQIIIMIIINKEMKVINMIKMDEVMDIMVVTTEQEEVNEEEM